MLGREVLGKTPRSTGPSERHHARGVSRTQDLMCLCLRGHVIIARLLTHKVTYHSGTFISTDQRSLALKDKARGCFSPAASRGTGPVDTFTVAPGDPFGADLQKGEMTNHIIVNTGLWSSAAVAILASELLVPAERTR